MEERIHQAVLLAEAVDALEIKPAGRYVDCTFGRGGHSRAILQALGSAGRLLAIDKDPEAVAEGSLLAAEDGRFAIARASFAELARLCAEQELGSLDGVLLDLGVSSPQLDQPERGFSFQRDGYLDMRMNPEQGQSAAEWLSGASEQDIAYVLKVYGEERFARRMAKAIVEERERAPIDSTLRLASIVSAAHPAWEKGRHPATRAFQAIRIYINDELGDLRQVLGQSLELLAVGGRLVVISFHSLEDRIVKQFIREHVRGDSLPASVPVMASQLNRRLCQVGKAVRATEAEVRVNVRARSAIMRVAEKIA